MDGAPLGRGRRLVQHREQLLLGRGTELLLESVELPRREQPGGRGLAAGLGEVERGLAGLVDGRAVGARLQQLPHHERVAGLRRLHQRRRAVDVRGLEVRAGAHERVHGVLVAVGRGVVQRRHAAAVLDPLGVVRAHLELLLRVDRRPRRDELADRRDVPVLARRDQHGLLALHRGHLEAAAGGRQVLVAAASQAIYPRSGPEPSAQRCATAESDGRAPTAVVGVDDGGAPSLLGA